jgi:hypothetical protein
MYEYLAYYPVQTVVVHDFSLEYGAPFRYIVHLSHNNVNGIPLDLTPAELSAR